MNPAVCKFVRQLQALYNELKVEEVEFHKKGNDEAECATYAAAERLKEVVKDFIAENQTSTIRDDEKPKPS